MLGNRVEVGMLAKRVWFARIWTRLAKQKPFQNKGQGEAQVNKKGRRRGREEEKEKKKKRRGREEEREEEKG